MLRNGLPGWQAGFEKSDCLPRHGNGQRHGSCRDRRARPDQVALPIIHAQIPAQTQVLQGTESVGYGGRAQIARSAHQPLEQQGPGNRNLRLADEPGIEPDEIGFQAGHQAHLAEPSTDVGQGDAKTHAAECTAAIHQAVDVPQRPLLPDLDHDVRGIQTQPFQAGIGRMAVQILPQERMREDADEGGNALRQ